MKIKIAIEECSIKKIYQAMSTVRGQDENLEFPLFTIDRDSYVIDSFMELNADDRLVCNVHIGRYTSIARDTILMIDQNHDYRRVCQGRISGTKYPRPEFIRRKGQLVIMNDCWIGEGSTIMSGITIGNGAVVAAGSVVTRDVPPFVVVAGNPATVIGYRFTKEQIEALNKIRWWNWDEAKVRANADSLYGDIDTFINNHRDEVQREINVEKLVEIPCIPERGNEGKRFLYIPDYEQDYPTYPHVIDAFTKAHAGTKNELLLFVRQDEFLEDKLEILNILFDRYKDVDCFVNLFEGTDEDIRGLLSQSDFFITNRNSDTVKMIDLADMFGVKVLSGVDIPVFNEEREIQHIIRNKEHKAVPETLNADILDSDVINVEQPSFKTLVVITPADCQRLLKLYPRLADGIKYGEICFVGSKEVGRIVGEDVALKGKVSAIDENSVIPFDEVHEVIRTKMSGILAGRELPRGITGWYYQQFLKMQYANICRDKYYMAWDGDTILCKELEMFDEETGKPFFDLKHEFHPEYFETLEILLPGYKKLIKKSFISEHMLFRTDIMRKLIQEIESNDAIPGTRFWEKIINAIPADKIQSSAFSEFETYGTYVTANYPDMYLFRDWHSFRLGGEFFSVDTISDRDFAWLAKAFYSISFEKGHSVRSDNANLFDNPRFQKKLTPRQMLEEAQKEYHEG
jgi:hypothetical protein